MDAAATEPAEQPVSEVIKWDVFLSYRSPDKEIGTAAQVIVTQILKEHKPYEEGKSR
jgi:hypothetical protein